MKAGPQTAPQGRATLDDGQRANLEGLAARMRRIVVGEFPELYLRVNEVRAQFEIAGKGLKKGSVVENEQKLEQARATISADVTAP